MVVGKRGAGTLFLKTLRRTVKICPFKEAHTKNILSGCLRRTTDVFQKKNFFQDDVKQKKSEEFGRTLCQFPQLATDCFIFHPFILN